MVWLFASWLLIGIEIVRKSRRGRQVKVIAKWPQANVVRSLRELEKVLEEGDKCGV